MAHEYIGDDHAVEDIRLARLDAQDGPFGDPAIAGDNGHPVYEALPAERERLERLRAIHHLATSLYDAARHDVSAQEQPTAFRRRLERQAAAYVRASDLGMPDDVALIHLAVLALREVTGQTLLDVIGRELDRLTTLQQAIADGTV